MCVLSSANGLQIQTIQTINRISLHLSLGGIIHLYLRGYKFQNRLHTYYVK